MLKTLCSLKPHDLRTTYFLNRMIDSAKIEFKVIEGLLEFSLAGRGHMTLAYESYFSRFGVSEISLKSID